MQQCCRSQERSTADVTWLIQSRRRVRVSLCSRLHHRRLREGHRRVQAVERGQRGRGRVEVQASTEGRRMSRGWAFVKSRTTTFWFHLCFPFSAFLFFHLFFFNHYFFFFLLIYCSFFPSLSLFLSFFHIYFHFLWTITNSITRLLNILHVHWLFVYLGAVTNELNWMRPLFIFRVRPFWPLPMGYVLQHDLQGLRVQSLSWPPQQRHSGFNFTYLSIAITIIPKCLIVFHNI